MAGDRASLFLDEMRRRDKFHETEDRASAIRILSECDRIREKVAGSVHKMFEQNILI